MQIDSVNMAGSGSTGTLQFRVITHTSVIQSLTLCSLDTAVSVASHTFTLTTSGDEPNVSVFATESPARIILDVADTNSQVDSATVSVGIGSVQTFTTLSAGGRTRLMVDRPVITLVKTTDKWLL